MLSTSNIFSFPASIQGRTVSTMPKLRKSQVCPFCGAKARHSFPS